MRNVLTGAGHESKQIKLLHHTGTHRLNGSGKASWFKCMCGVARSLRVASLKRTEESEMPDCIPSASS